jgi:hypothetical protein
MDDMVSLDKCMLCLLNVSKCALLCNLKDSLYIYVVSRLARIPQVSVVKFRI